MLTVKVVWPTEFLNYHVYTANEYCVCALVDGSIHLLLDGSNSIDLGEDTKVYVMNKDGATVDKIHNVRKVTRNEGNIPPEPNVARDMWVNPDTGKTEERFGF